MTVAAVCCWYEESPEFLDRMARSLAGVAAQLVSLDGPWRHFDHCAPHSPPEQHEALAAAAAAAELEHVVLPNPGEWESQVAKRAHLYSTAIAVTGCDWILIVDGDEYVAEASPDLHEQLAAVNRDVARVTCTRITAGRPSKDRAVHRLFRGIPGLTVEGTHNGIRTPDGRNLHGPRKLKREPAADLTGLLRLEHTFMARPLARNTASRRYYQIRSRRKIEVFT